MCQELGSRPFDALKACLGPQEKVAPGPLRMLEALKARLGQPNNDWAKSSTSGYGTRFTTSKGLINESPSQFDKQTTR